MYQYPILSRLSCRLRNSGKRRVSDRIIHETASFLKKSGYSNPYKRMVEAIDHVKPMVELRTQKKSGQRIQIPSAMTPSRQEGSALRLIKEAGNVRKKNSKGGAYSYHLAQEFISVLRTLNRVDSNSNLRGVSTQIAPSISLAKRDTQHRMAVAQRGSLR